MQHEELSGVFNCSAPEPVTNKEFMKTLRQVLHMPVGLPAPEWLLKAGAVFIRTETELILKSRRVVPQRLLDAGYKFRFDTIDAALLDLCA